MSKHSCPREGCNKMLDSNTLACKPHWFLVSLQTRRALQAAWRTGALGTYIELREDAVREMNHVPTR